MHHTAKPVGKCYGCGLNLGDHCGVFADPRVMWQRHTACPGYMNAELLADYQASLSHKDANVRKEKRRLVAKMRQEETHHQGDRHVLMAVRH